MVISQPPRVTKLGSCRFCINLSIVLLTLGLLVLGQGENINQPILIGIGLVTSTGFGLLVGLHALFFILKRKRLVAVRPPVRVGAVQQPRRRCCGS